MEGEMADRPLSLRPDADLEAALRDLGGAIAWPDAERPLDGGRDIAGAVRARIEAPRPSRTGGWTWRPARRALVLAVVLLLALAAVAVGTGVGVPGLRLIFGAPPTSVSPPPSLEPSRSPAVIPGATMDLGTLVDLSELDDAVGYHVAWPDDPDLGAPDAAWVDPRKGDQVSLVWTSRPDLPETLEPGVGLVLTTFRADVMEGAIQKVITGATSATPVAVGTRRGYWITGDPHFLFYVGDNGRVEDPRRWVGDALIWSDGRTSHRLESSLGRAATIALAEAMP
jgi:hypothetical protein